MLNDSDTVGHTFRRAFYRVDGVTMYVCWAIWIGKLIWALFDPQSSGIQIIVLIMIGLANPVLFVMLGLWRFPGLLAALIIMGVNIRWLFELL